MTITSHCYQTIQACMIRASRLTTAGAPVSGTDQAYVSDTVISVNFQPETETGDEFTQKNGCGDICVTAKSADHTKRVTLSSDLCNLDAELLELLTGGTLLQDSGQTIGYNAPLPTDTAPTVLFELWSKAWNGSAQAVDSDGNGLYFHWVFSKSQFVIGSTTLQNGVSTIPVSGTSDSNPALGDGPFDDLPTGVSTWGPFAFFLTTDIPTSACGYIDVPAQ